uniref:Uncharacterized protein n=1 Tax=Meloidogyne javanica TaxID=6303 RepID=A0A915M3V8_MELJA
MIIQSELLLLLLMFFNSFHCWVIGPALASTEYSKRLQQAQQLRNEKQLAETSETSFVLPTTTETTQETTTTEPITPEEIHYDKNEKKGDNEKIDAGQVQSRHDEYKKMAEFVLKNNLSESDVIDPWKDDVTSLGLTVNSTNSSNETDYEVNDEEENNTKNRLMELKNNDEVLSQNNSQNVENESESQNNAGLHIRIHIRPSESFAERRARLCSSHLTPYMPKFRTLSTPFIVYNVSCIYQNTIGKRNDHCFAGKYAFENKSLTTALQIWKNSESCFSGLTPFIENSSECLVVIGYVDNIIDMTKATVPT